VTNPQIEKSALCVVEGKPNQKQLGRTEWRASQEWSSSIPKPRAPPRPRLVYERLWNFAAVRPAYVRVLVAQCRRLYGASRLTIAAPPLSAPAISGLSKIDQRIHELSSGEVSWPRRVFRKSPQSLPEPKASPRQQSDDGARCSSLWPPSLRISARAPYTSPMYMAFFWSRFQFHAKDASDYTR